MNVDEEVIQNRCTDAVFERGQNYHQEGHIQQIERFDNLITAAVQGSKLYDITVEFTNNGIDTRCTCPYDGPGDCKHVVAVLLDLSMGPPADESDQVEALLDDVAADDLRVFVRGALATHPELRDQFLAQFGDEHKSVQEYREEIEQLFNQHADPTVFTAIDFSRFFEMAERYRDRDMYLAAATVYRALFEEIDEQFERIDGAYDHYVQALQRALDGYADCILVADLTPDEFDTYAGVLEERVATRSSIMSSSGGRSTTSSNDTIQREKETNDEG
jgi:uncharacterized Zn finger protein